MTGINEMEEDKEDFFRMKFSEVAPWIASWCRDNQLGDLWDAMTALYKSRNKISIDPDGIRVLVPLE